MNILTRLWKNRKTPRKRAAYLPLACALALVLSACAPKTPVGPDPGTEPPYISMVNCPVSKGRIVSSFCVSGVIRGEEQAVSVYEIPGVEDPAGFYEFLGKSVQSGDALWQDTAFAADGVVVDVAYQDGTVTVTLLDCSALYVSAPVSYGQYTRLDYGTPVSVHFQGEEIPGSIARIGYSFENEMTQVKVTCANEHLRPGMRAELEFITDVRENGLYVPVDAVFYDGAQAYVKVKNGQTIDVANVICGETFESESDGNVWKHVEILAGLEEGMTVVFDVLDGSLGAHIYEEFIE